MFSANGVKPTAKDIRIKLIDNSSGNKFVKRHHYSGKVVPNSQISYGVFLNGKLEGVLQYGPPMARAKMLGLLEGIKWYDLIELNRMAFSERLPRNSESRAIAYTLRNIKKHKPNMRMVISFADGCQCGDGTIYRASGFYLTNIKKNVGLRVNPKTGEVLAVMTAYHNGIRKEFNKWKPLTGYQLRYIYLYDKSDEKKLNVPIIPFSKIKEVGASMYKGNKLNV